MYGMYKQLHPPTGVEHCLTCHFFNDKELNLVVGSVNQLSVYKLNSDVETQAQKSGEKPPDGKTKKEKLECIMSTQLFGNISSMQTVRLAGSSRDSILLAFRDAKLAVIEYDHSTHDLKTSSLHYFEQDDLKDGLVHQSLHPPIVRVDPEGRCAIMLIYGTRLVVLPFRKDTGSTEDQDNLLGINKHAIMSSYIIDLRKLDEKITNVIDLQFLHGYYEPTVFILFEPLPTWAGRIAIRKDTSNIVAISLNIQEKVHPIIWSLGNLPFDCLKAFPVPKPVGGVLVFAVNSLTYLNQSFPPYGVSLNSITDFSTDFLLRPQEGVKMSLDCANACFISSEKLVISLKGGELYVLTLRTDSMRAVRSFHLDKAAASVLTTCMCKMQDDYIFLGSHLGNSLLLKCNEKKTEAQIQQDKVKEKTDGEPQAKKARNDNLSDWMASDISTIDLDDLEVYGKETAGNTQGSVTQFSFEVCDSLMNIGPCGQCVMGEPAFLSEEFNHLVDPDLETVTTSGYGKNGAISVLQRTIRPQVVTTFELPGCVDMWTVIGKVNQDEAEKGHSYLILSKDDCSMVLETGQELMELDHSGFATGDPTIFAGNIGNDKYIIQVSDKGIRLLEGAKQLQHIPIDMGSKIVECSLADPYLVLKSLEGQVLLLHLKPDVTGFSVRLAVSRSQVPGGSIVQTFCLYTDTCGVFTTTSDGADISDDIIDDIPVVKDEAQVTNITSMNTDDMDEDEMLYGDAPTARAPQPSQTIKREPEAKPRATTETKDIKPTYWLALVRQNGSFEIFTVPDFKLAFHVKSFPFGHRILVDSLQSSDKVHEKGAATEVPVTRELLVTGLGHKGARPYLMAWVNEELLVYEAFNYFASSPDDRLKLRFKKIQHGLLLNERKMRGARAEDDIKVESDTKRKYLRKFRDISGYDGVFICGPSPHWLFMSARGVLRLHPMSIDGAIYCFTPFHNVNCPKGFLYFNRLGELRISVLPTHLSYDAPWPVRKVPLRCTPHFVAYHIESKTYSVVTSVSEPCTQVIKVVGDGEKEFETQERDERFILPTIEKYTIQLFSPVSWEPIPNTKFELEEFEHVTCIKCVYLKSEGTLSGLKTYMAVGTNYNYNEDVTSRGRLLIYDVIDVVPEPGQPLTKNKMKFEYEKEQKGPVTALDHVSGLLVSALGQKIYVWQLKDQDLIGVAFIDTQIYIHSITTIKNLILIADIYKGIMLMRYQPDLKVLSIVSKDSRPLETYSVGYLVDNRTLTFMVSDRLKNLIVYTYQPEMRESLGGQKLLRQADFNLGHHVNTFFRVKCKQSDPSTDKRMTGQIEKRHVTYFATLDGSIGYVLPITEKTYRRLLMVQNTLAIQIQHVAGLNPKGYRQMQVEFKTLTNTQKNILDGELLWKFMFLGLNERNDLAKRIGTTTEQIIEDLVEMDRSAAHF